MLTPAEVRDLLMTASVRSANADARERIRLAELRRLRAYGTEAQRKQAARDLRDEGRS